MAGQAPWRSQAAPALRRGGRNGEINGGAFLHVEGTCRYRRVYGEELVGGADAERALTAYNTVHRKFVAVGLNHG